MRNALRRWLLSTSGEKLNVKADKNYVLTTVVDSRYKFRFLDNKETAKKWLLDEMQAAAVADTDQTEQTEGNAATAEKATDTSTQRRTNSNTAKTLKKEIHDNFMKCYEDDHDLPYSSSDDERENADYLKNHKLICYVYKDHKLIYYVYKDHKLIYYVSTRLN